MGFCGVGFAPSLDGLELLSYNGSRPNYSQLGLFDTRLHSVSRAVTSSRRVKCSVGKAVSPPDPKGNSQKVNSFHIEQELGPVTKFKMSDFEICNHVSVGLAGRSDEVIFEAIVKDSQSPLYNSKVVLRRLRRGRRALEVLKKLARCMLMYHSYAMQVHGYVTPNSGHYNSFTLVHGYHGSYSLRHWLQLSNWFPTLEATLALNEECVRRVGDDRVGGPAISRKLRLIRILMPDLLIGVNYLHSHGLAHTELRLENVHISPVDRHIKVGILGNAANFDDNSNNTLEASADRGQLMIAFDIRCVGFMMAKMVLKELMDPSIFMKFKSFLNKMLDRNWGAGWNLLSLLLATKPSERKSCLDALRHPFLCGLRWRVEPSMDIIKWGLGSTAVRITEEYIYGRHQRNRLSYFIELMEMLNPHPKEKDWVDLLPGRWRLLYCTGRHIGLTLRQPSLRVLIGNVHLNLIQSPNSERTLSMTSDIGFMVMTGSHWPHDKLGIRGKLQCCSAASLAAGSRLYLKEEKESEGRHAWGLSNSQEYVAREFCEKIVDGQPLQGAPDEAPSGEG